MNKVMKWMPILGIIVISISYFVKNCEVQEGIVGLGLFLLIADQAFKLFNESK